ncbi:hypothetical protein BC831DRAFT_548808 [Entophlyctis helioformis]|nr:hypothetical protein BC831DRAFT_548808 [Entophlyctis helioformis]
MSSDPLQQTQLLATSAPASAPASASAALLSLDAVRLEKGRSMVPYTGTLTLTPHLLQFRAAAGPTDPDIETIWLSTVVSVDRKFPTPDGLHPVYLACRHFLAVKLYFTREADAVAVFAGLQRGVNITSLQQVYAFAYRREVAGAMPNRGWDVFDPALEFGRMGVGSSSRHWRLSHINENYEFSATYPAVFAVPSRISDNVIKHIGSFRSKSRIPALSYIHRTNQVSITRSSQPMVGLKQTRSIQDEKLIEAIFASSPLSPAAGTTHLIIDARPTTNAMAQTAMGAGTESSDNYRGSRVVFLGIDNIHVVRDSMNRLFDAFVSLDAPLIAHQQPAHPYQSPASAAYSASQQPSPHQLHQSPVLQHPPVSRTALDRSGWLKHIRNIMDGTLLIVQSVHVNNAHVLVHCSDGWDRTAQLSSLSQLCLDPYYRTIQGFQVLIEKEWVSFGHKFKDRCGHLCHDSGNSNATSSGSSSGGMSSEGGANGSGSGFDDRAGPRGQPYQQQPTVASQFQMASKNVGASLTSAAKSFLGSSKKSLFSMAASASSSPFIINALGGPGASAAGTPSSRPTTSSAPGISISASSAGSSGSSPYLSATSNAPLSLAMPPMPMPPPSATQPQTVLLASSETHTPKNVAPREISPVFPQFLDTLYQIWTQFPTHFEFDERLLGFLFLHAYSCMFGNFLFNNERERAMFVARSGSGGGGVTSPAADGGGAAGAGAGTRIQDTTVSIWDYIELHKDEFLNPLYVAPDAAAAMDARRGMDEMVGETVEQLDRPAPAVPPLFTSSQESSSVDVFSSASVMPVAGGDLGSSAGGGDGGNGGDRELEMIPMSPTSPVGTGQAFTFPPAASQSTPQQQPQQRPLPPVPAGSGTGRVDPLGSPGTVSADHGILFPSSANLRYWTSFYLKTGPMASVASAVSPPDALFAADASVDGPVSSSQQTMRTHTPPPPPPAMTVAGDAFKPATGQTQAPSQAQVQGQGQGQGQVPPAVARVPSSDPLLSLNVPTPQTARAATPMASTADPLTDGLASLAVGGAPAASQPAVPPAAGRQRVVMENPWAAPPTPFEPLGAASLRRRLLPIHFGGHIWTGVPAGTVVQLGGLPTYYAAPPPPLSAVAGAPASSKAVLVVHDGYSFELANSRLLCDAMASETGSHVFMPDLFQGDRLASTPAIDALWAATPTVSASLVQGLKIVASLPATLKFLGRHGPAVTMPLLTAVLRDIKRDYAADRVGVVGYCWGGRYAFKAAQLAVADTAIRCFVAAHPSGMDVPADTAGIAVPGLVIAAVDDPVVSVKSLRKLGTGTGTGAGSGSATGGVVEVVEYKGVTHGFAVRGREEDAVVQHARDDALLRTIGWLNTHL